MDRKKCDVMLAFAADGTHVLEILLYIYKKKHQAPFHN